MEQPTARVKAGLTLGCLFGVWTFGLAYVLTGHHLAVALAIGVAVAAAVGTGFALLVSRKERPSA